jgi:hypothetical protein
MALEGQHELNVIAERIKTAAADKGLNLDDPEYEHTLWCDLIDWMQFTGKYGPDFQAACHDGKRHQSGRTYIARGPLRDLQVLMVEH